MKTIRTCAPLSVLVLVLIAAGVTAAHAEILDRIMAVVNGRIITLSDVKKQQETLRALRGEDLTEEVVLQNLIDQFLIDEQIAQSAPIEVSAAEVAERIRRLGIDEESLPEGARETIAGEIRRARFLDQRFRQFVRITEEEARRYYDMVFVPEARRRGLDPIPPIEEVQDAIRNNAAEEKMTEDVEAWLDGIHRRSEVEVFP